MSTIPTVNHLVSSIALTRTIFDEILSNPEKYENSLVMISPLCRPFVLGDLDKADYAEVNDTTWDYTIFDAALARREIRFIDNVSEYSVLISGEGLLCDTTGLTIEGLEGDDLHWAKVELGYIHLQ